MATYSEHVTASISDFTATPISAAYLDKYITMGTKEVISNVLKFNPAAGLLFAKESVEQTVNGYEVTSGIVYSVVREDGYDNQWREAKQADLSKQYLVTDPDSFFFASKYNPVFIRDNNKLSVFPVPSAQEEAYKVYEIKYPEFDNNGNTLKASTNIDDIGIENFPSSFHPHLVLHGVLKSLNRIYNVIITEEEDIELSNSIANSIKNLKEDYVNMFVSKDVLAPQAQQPQQRRG